MKKEHPFWSRLESFVVHTIVEPIANLAMVFILIVLIARFGLPYLKDVMPQKTTITNQVVQESLIPLGELATYEMSYSGSGLWEDERLIPWTSIAIPGTYNSTEVAYSGKIKVGYHVSEIGIDVNNRSKTITVSLPAAAVLSNDISLDSHHEQLSFFNRIPDESIPLLLSEAKAEELSSAEEKDLYALAEEHAQTLISTQLEQFCEYTVVFAN